MHNQKTSIAALPPILKNAACSISQKLRAQEDSAIKTLPALIDLANDTLISRQGG